MTCDLYNRVTQQQGYEPHEYEVLTKSEDIGFASDMERQLQEAYGYEVDRVPYNKLKCNNMNMKINVTEQTTTFPCPVNKLKGQLMDNLNMRWETDHGDCMLTPKTVEWILKNVKESMYNTSRCYIYNKAFSRFHDNNDIWDFRINKNGPLDNAYQSHDRLGGNLEDPHMKDQYDGKTLAGALSPTRIQERCNNPECKCLNPTHFDLIRKWADERGLYDNGDPKTQALKLVEEVGETCRAILKNDTPEVIDGIGDCVVVLTNLAQLIGHPIEECINKAYIEISNRKGKMINGTFTKDE
jgi:NTP pyrophosphatase (non-canonical NTP hydrolase)